MEIKALVFDEGDTLYDASYWRKQIFSVLKKKGYKKTFSRMIVSWEQKLVPVYIGEKKYDTAFEEFLKQEGFGQKSGEIIRLSNALKKKVPEKRKLFSGVKETLAKLKAKGIKLAVLSDSESGEQAHRKVLQELGINTFFDFVVTSIDYGMQKPEKQFYLKVLEFLDVSPAQTFFVSHDSEELEGAKNAGMKTISFNDSVYSDKKPSSDFRIKNFSELLEITG